MGGDDRVRIAHRESVRAAQRTAVEDLFLSREKIVGLDGVAGAGKTTALSVIREDAEADGYRVEGFAPTSRATQKLAEAGMETSTLQRHLARGQICEAVESLDNGLPASAYHSKYPGNVRPDI